MPLLDLSNELLLSISECLETGKDINAFVRTNRYLYHLLDPYLYSYNVQQSESSALLWAARLGREVTAQNLLREKANVQATNHDDEAPLLLAAENGHEQVVKLLVEEGADANAQGGDYGNALQAASYRGHEAVVKMLLDKQSCQQAKQSKIPAQLELIDRSLRKELN
jgi:ankyrin repeat protein